MMRAPIWLGALVILMGGCTSPSGAPVTGPGPTGGGGGGAGGAAGGGAATGGAAGGPTPPGDCTQPQAASIRLTALTESQFNNSALDLLQVSGNLLKGV